MAFETALMRLLTMRAAEFPDIDHSTLTEAFYPLELA
jgi:hypothetical protein